jgi:hypothetical protein
MRCQGIKAKFGQNLLTLRRLATFECQMFRRDPIPPPHPMKRVTEIGVSLGLP